jgi:hypothetical protein
MATFEGLAGMQTLSVPSGAYVKMSPDQLARAAQSLISANLSSEPLDNDGNGSCRSEPAVLC